MQICLCWFPFSSFVWLRQQHVSLEGRGRTAIKAHISGFYFSPSMRALSTKRSAWCRWMKMSWDQMEISTQTCVCMPVCLCATVCAHACTLQLTDVPCPNLILQMLARSLPQIAGISISCFSSVGWGRVEEVVMVVVGGGCEGYSRFAGFLFMLTKVCFLEMGRQQTNTWTLLLA